MPTLETPATDISSCQLGDTLRATARRFRAAGLDTPDLDARILMEAVTGLSQATLFASPERPIPTAQFERLAAYVERRLAHEPVSRILGRRQFWGRDFEISPDTLDPRADTETLIDAALRLIAEDGPADRPLRILDIGAGTGCLLLTLLAELPAATGTGIDTSASALAIARGNATRLGLERRATWIEGDALAGLAGQLDRVEFDLVVSNPPYIPSHEIADLALEVQLFDPYVALDGGRDGLRFYRGLIPHLAQTASNSWVVFEVGAGQSDDVRQMIVAAGGGADPGAIPDTIREFVDLGGHSRCVAFRTR